MKNFNIMRTVCIDVALVLLITLIVSVFLKKPIIVPIIEGTVCILSLIGAYSFNKKISSSENLS
ncbi:hypothetical protein JK636_01810 [Clostridium sp. YIM B02515]|uniref:Uncharacterized protein n=1 Tax=Clostridium rhizosphaerae TaxID=2803861 RepID=A0ABS1T591_9CLOT|nr:hypothetical protein [Clostridium rhizosphaerae]MBL4934490.1 hypothetical protein [Clostridium rhizosphaerae]